MRVPRLCPTYQGKSERIFAGNFLLAKLEQVLRDLCSLPSVYLYEPFSMLRVGLHRYTVDTLQVY